MAAVKDAALTHRRDQHRIRPTHLLALRSLVVVAVTDPFTVSSSVAVLQATPAAMRKPPATVRAKPRPTSPGIEFPAATCPPQRLPLQNPRPLVIRPGR